MRKVFLLSMLISSLLLAPLALADEYRVNLGLTSLGGDSGNLEEIEGTFLEGQALLRRQFFSALDVPFSLRLSGKRFDTDDGAANVSFWRARAGLGHSSLPASELGHYARVQVELIHVPSFDAVETRGYPHAELGLTGQLRGSPWELGVMLSGSEEDADRFPVLGHAAIHTGLHDQIDWGITLSGSHERIDLGLGFRWY